MFLPGKIFFQGCLNQVKNGVYNPPDINHSGYTTKCLTICPDLGINPSEMAVLQSETAAYSMRSQREPSICNTKEVYIMENTHPPIQKRRKTSVWVVVGLSALALIAIAGVVLLFVLKSVVGSYTDTYASTEIRVFPVPTMTAEDARPLLDDFKAFKTAIENREPPAQAIYDNPDAMRLLKHIESITVENGRLVIKPKSEE